MMPRRGYMGFALAYDSYMACHLLVIEKDQHTLIMLLYFHLLEDLSSLAFFTLMKSDGSEMIRSLICLLEAS